MRRGVAPRRARPAAAAFDASERAGCCDGDGSRQPPAAGWCVEFVVTDPADGTAGAVIGAAELSICDIYLPSFIGVSGDRPERFHGVKSFFVRENLER